MQVLSTSAVSSAEQSKLRRTSVKRHSACNACHFGVRDKDVTYSVAAAVLCSCCCWITRQHQRNSGPRLSLRLPERLCGVGKTSSLCWGARQQGERRTTCCLGGAARAWPSSPDRESSRTRCTRHQSCNLSTQNLYQGLQDERVRRHVTVTLLAHVARVHAKDIITCQPHFRVQPVMVMPSLRLSDASLA